MTRLITNVAAILALSTAVASAQNQPVAASGGHWEGSVTAPIGEIRVEVDLARDPKGAWTGAFGQPDQGLRGLPLNNVSVDGSTVRFAVGSGPGATTFTGTVSERSMTGNATSPAGTVPFRLTRTGDAVIDAPARSAEVSKMLEGRWNGTLAAGGQQLRLLLKIANQADGSASASLTSVDQSGLEMPATVTEKGADVTWEVKGTRATFVGKLNSSGEELTGTFTQGPASLPLTFRRATDEPRPQR